MGGDCSRPLFPGGCEAEWPLPQVRACALRKARRRSRGLFTQAAAVKADIEWDLWNQRAWPPVPPASAPCPLTTLQTFLHDLSWRPLRTAGPALVPDRDTKARGAVNPLGHTKEGQSRNYTGFSPHLARARLCVAFSCLQGSSQPLASMALTGTRSGPTLARRSAEGTRLGSHVLGFAVCCSRAAVPTTYSVAPGWRGAQALGNWAAGHPSGGWGGRVAGVALLASALPVPRPHSVPLPLCFWVSASSLLS